MAVDIPQRLLRFNPGDWARDDDAPSLFGGPGEARLRALERYRQAQDAFAQQHGLDRDGFVRLADEQRWPGPVTS